MADMKFACPHCGQHITCDELWAGQELQCPGCQGTLGVPVPAAPAAGSGGLVPKVPTHAAPRLSLGQAAGGGSAAQVPAQSRTVPVRNLAPPPPKKKNPLVTYGVGFVVLAALAVGGYYGYGYVSAIQERHNAKQREAEKDSGGGEVAHTKSLYAALDATEPGKIPGERTGRATGPRQKAGAAAQDIPVPADPNAAANPADQPASVPVTWTLEVNTAKIPDGRVGGKISGTNFTADATRIDPVGTAQVLRMLQGSLASPDREVLIYLHLKPGETLGGQTLTISQDLKGSSVPQVSKRWKTDPKFAPKQQNYMSGYAMKLTLGAMTNGLVPGKIYLALPDTEQSVLAGTFEAVTRTADPNLQAAPVVTPTATPAPGPAANDAYRQRYGIRR